MITIIEALRTTHNLETYRHKLNDNVNVHITKLDVNARNIMLQYESHGQLLHAEVLTSDEIISRGY